MNPHGFIIRVGIENEIFSMYVSKQAIMVKVQFLGAKRYVECYGYLTELFYHSLLNVQTSI